MESFFEENPLQVLTYVCNFGDKKHLIRHRKFTQWYSHHQADLAVVKKDGMIMADDDQYPVSLLIWKEHPYHSAIEQQFFHDVQALSK